MKNTINIWKQGWAKGWTWVAFTSNITNFFRNIKYSFQRIARGCCDRDVWNLNDYLQELTAESLGMLANTSHGFTLAFSSYEEWIEWLRATSKTLANTVTFNDCPDYNLSEEEEDAYDALLDKHYSEALENGTEFNEWTPTEQKYITKFHNKITELDKKRVNDRDKALQEVVSHFDCLCD